MKKEVLVLALACIMSIGLLGGCGVTEKTDTKVSNTTTPESTPKATVLSKTDTTQEKENKETEEEENYNTGDATLDNTRNQDKIGDKELMVVSFGTSYNESRRLTIGAIEQKFEDTFGTDYSIRRAFTSQIIIDHVKKRDNITIDNVKNALDRAATNGVKTLVVQPAHLMNGFEYSDLEKEISEYSDAFEQVAIGKPLLTSDEDFNVVMKAITEATKEYDDGKTAIVFMGHGTKADSNKIYPKMQKLLKKNGYKNYYIGTVEATPSIDDVITAIKQGKYKRVVMEPLMIVAGDHANNDMAGDEEDSWKSKVEKEGYEVKCILRGLGELPQIQDLFAKHGQEAIDSLKKQ